MGHFKKGAYVKEDRTWFERLSTPNGDIVVQKTTKTTDPSIPQQTIYSSEYATFVHVDVTDLPEQDDLPARVARLEKMFEDIVNVTNKSGNLESKDVIMLEDLIKYLGTSKQCQNSS